MTFSDFSGLGLADPLLRALGAQNHHTPTPIQAKAIPPLLTGQDLLGIAQTGTGKTGAFALPLLHKLSAQKSRPRPGTARALVLAPTRELAGQIADSFKSYGRHLSVSHTLVFGGVRPGPQVKALARGVDVLVATPGRLIDHLGQGNIRLDEVATLVLDEADRMLDMGFVRDVRKIVAALPRERQTAMFSATMPKEVEVLARQILSDPVKVEATPEAVTADRVDQCVHHVRAADKRAFLADLLDDPAMRRVIVFTRTKHGANRVAASLGNAGIESAAMHGNKSQAARQKALAAFRTGDLRVLVATDIAARGIDVPEISHVVNYEIPNEAETYVHRIGRTARAGNGGMAVSLCDPEERAHLLRIEKLCGKKIRTGEGEIGNPSPKPGVDAQRGGVPPVYSAGKRGRRRGGSPRRKAA